MSCKISIIVPVYNVEKYLNKCIDSILSQTFKDFELILVNDGSTDNSGDICNKYKSIDERIRVIHKTNGGLSDARNKGIEISKGDYIGFVDSDDYIHKNMYEILYNNAIENISDIVVCDFNKVYEQDKKTYMNNYEDVNIDIYNFNNIEALYQIYKGKSATFVVAWNKLYKRDLFGDLRFELGRLHEDEFIAHKLLHRSKNITYVPVELYYYMQRSNSIVKSPFNKNKLDLVDALGERVEFFRNINEYELQIKAERYYIELFMIYYYKAKLELEDIDSYIKKMKKDFNKIINIGFILKNKLFNVKEKIILMIFKLNPRLHQVYQMYCDN